MATTITVKLFGSIVDIVQSSVLTLEDVEDVHSLKEKLFLLFPALQKIQFAIALDKKIIHENTIITEQSDIALLPPFSGG